MYRLVERGADRGTAPLPACICKAGTEDMTMTGALLRLRHRERWKPAEDDIDTDGKEPNQIEYQSIHQQ